MFVRGFRAVGGGYPFPGEEFRVGSSPGRSLNMRGMFNPELGPVGKAVVTTRNANQFMSPNWAPASAGEVKWGRL